MGCRVNFRDGGGIIHYPDGRKIPFIERLGVFFVALNVLPEAPTEDAFGRKIKDGKLVPGFPRREAQR